MGSFQMPVTMLGFASPESSCGYLLQELKLIWDEVGQDKIEREKVLLELEQECMDVYRRKVDSANMSRARLHQALADSEAEFTHLLVSLGERSFPGRPEKMTGALKEQLDSITPALNEMKLRKEERINKFREVQVQIQRISAEIEGRSENDISSTNVIVNESDLSFKKLEEFRNELQWLLKEKSDRLVKVEVHTRAVYNLAATMGLDSSKIIKKVHPSLDTSSGQQPKNISDTILERLNNKVESLKEEKQRRLDKLHRLQKSLSNLWNLMDSSAEERKQFAQVTDFISAKATDISSPGRLTLDIIQEVESEVQRLDQLKASKMKELFLKKYAELEEICKKSHMSILSQLEMDNIMNLINSGEMDHADLLMSMDKHIFKAKEEASSRRDIMEKVEKWMASCNEERWLEEYNRDENRYSVRRGAHKNLKRAERARITVQRIPALVDLMMRKTTSWEEERKKVFLYDEVPLLALLEEYNFLRQEKEEEKQRQREKKRLEGQVAAEQENLFGSRPSTSSYHIPNRSLNGSFVSTTPSNRRVAVENQQVGPIYSAATQGNKKVQRPKQLGRSNLASHLRDDIASKTSAVISGLQ